MALFTTDTEPRRDPVLEPLDLVIFELEDETALHTDQVIVMVADSMLEESGSVRVSVLSSTVGPSFST